MKVWCVQHRKGWCAIKGNIPYAETAGNVPTECDYFVIMHTGIAEREPTCDHCREKLGCCKVEGNSCCMDTSSQEEIGCQTCRKIHNCGGPGFDTSRSCYEPRK